MQIALESLSKCFGKLRALENVTATIKPGQIIAILGANGGKNRAAALPFCHSRSRRLGQRT
jgi:ABC-type uncharacterized transport system ATPase subunit